MPCKQRDIQAFTRVSKPTSNGSELTKRRRGANNENVADSKKRRVLQLETPPDTPANTFKRGLVDSTISASLKSAKRKRSPLSPALTVNMLPMSTNSEDIPILDIDTDCIPLELQELEQLNASFLTALSLHYAHSGTSSPVDVRTLTPSITRLWGKRKVGIDDIRLCIGILLSTGTGPGLRNVPIFGLSNYGNGRICIDLAALARKQAPIGQAFDESKLNTLFAERLRKRWRCFAGTNKNATFLPFLEQLPRADISFSASAGKAQTLLLKGQRRLEQVLQPKEDGEHGTEKRRRLNTVEGLRNNEDDSQRSNPHPDVEPSSLSWKRPDPTSSLTANIRSLSLLERIRTKEFNHTNETSGLSKAELERRAAFQRAEELLGILDLLATSKGGGQRVSFPLPALVRNVQSSLRSPMSKDEIERCLQVLEKEVAPWYVSMAKFGTVVGVVVNRGFRPTKEDVQARLTANM